MNRTWAQVVSTKTVADTELAKISQKWKMHRDELEQSLYYTVDKNAPLRSYIFTDVFNGMAGSIARCKDEAVYYIISDYLTISEYDDKSMYIRNGFIGHCQTPLINGWDKELNKEINRLIGPCPNINYLSHWCAQGNDGTQEYCIWTGSEHKMIRKSLIDQLLDMFSKSICNIKPLSLGQSFICGGDY